MSQQSSEPGRYDDNADEPESERRVHEEAKAQPPGRFDDSDLNVEPTDEAEAARRRLHEAEKRQAPGRFDDTEDEPEDERLIHEEEKLKPPGQFDDTDQ